MGRIEEVRKAYPTFTDLALEIANPTHNNKYLMWIASQLDNKYNKSDIAATIEAFNKDSCRLKFKDIYQYKDLKTLENELKDLEISHRQAEMCAKESGAIKLYSDKECTLIRINSKKSMVLYGKATRWCVSMEREEYWEQYSMDGNIFYVLIDNTDNKKYAIQKAGLVDVSIWAEDDRELNINDWLKRNKKFTDAIFACIHDREEPMLMKIGDFQISIQEFKDWLSFQHPKTIEFLKVDYPAHFYYYNINQNEEINSENIKHIQCIRLEYLRKIQEKHPNFITNIAKYLAANKKIKLPSLRQRIARLIPNPEIVLRDDEANLIKLKTDPSLASVLLSNKKATVWKKALPLIDINTLLSLLPTLTGNKQSECLKTCISKVDASELLLWISTNKIQLPNNVLYKTKEDTKSIDSDELYL